MVRIRRRTEPIEFEFSGGFSEARRQFLNRHDHQRLQKI
jgi:hypothetical protein